MEILSKPRLPKDHKRLKGNHRYVKVMKEEPQYMVYFGWTKKDHGGSVLCQCFNHQDALYIQELVDRDLRQRGIL